MTNLSHPTTRLGRSAAKSETAPSSAGPQASPRGGAAEAGLDSDSVYSYALDGITPASVDPSGGSDPQDSIDLEGLAEQLYRLLLHEAYLERERHGAQR